jgi:hypothetical protein
MHNHLYLTGAFRTIFLWQERYLARQADFLMTVNEGLSRVLAKRIGKGIPTVVFNGPSETFEPPTEAPKLPLKTYYQGNFQAGRGIDETLLAMTSLKDRVTLTLQGSGELLPELEECSAELGLDDRTVEFLAACPSSQVESCANRYDIGLISVQPICLNNILSLPNKVFTYLGGALVAITTAEAPEIAALLKRHDCGVVIDSWCAEHIAKALDELTRDPSRVLRLRTNAHKAAVELKWEQQFAPVVDWLQGKGVIPMAHASRD